MRSVEGILGERINYFVDGYGLVGREKFEGAGKG